MLVVPRVVALFLMLPLLTIIADVVSMVGGAWMANTYAHISYVTFLDSARATVPFTDFLKGLVKSLVFAIIIALIVVRPLLGQSQQAFQYIQEFTGFFTPGITVIFLLGLFWKRANEAGALTDGISAVAGSTRLPSVRRASTRGSSEKDDSGQGLSPSNPT